MLNYLELPILAKFTWGRTLQFYADAGFYAGYLLHAEEKTKGTSPIYEDQKGDPLTVQGYPVPPQNFTANTDITSSIKRFNVGVTGGVGLALPLDARNKAFFDARVRIRVYQYPEIQRGRVEQHRQPAPLAGLVAPFWEVIAARLYDPRQVRGSSS